MYDALTGKTKGEAWESPKTNTLSEIGEHWMFGYKSTFNL
jgi:hypothetical protein